MDDIKRLWKRNIGLYDFLFTLNCILPIYLVSLYTLLVILSSRDVKHYIYKSNYFGDSKAGVLDNVKCIGNEKDISQCVSTYQTTCSSSNAVGLKCG